MSKSEIIGKFEYPIEANLLVQLLKAFFENPFPAWMIEIVKIETENGIISNVLKDGRILVSIVDQSYETAHEVEITKQTLVRGVVSLAETAFGENSNGQLLLLKDLINHQIDRRSANLFFQNLVFGGVVFKV